MLPQILDRRLRFYIKLDYGILPRLGVPHFHTFSSYLFAHGLAYASSSARCLVGIAIDGSFAGWGLGRREEGLEGFDYVASYHFQETDENASEGCVG